MKGSDFTSHAQCLLMDNSILDLVGVKGNVMSMCSSETTKMDLQTM